MPLDLPPWHTVYRQTQRWLNAGCFETMTHGLRMLLRIATYRLPAPTTTVIDSRTLQSARENGGRTGYDSTKRCEGSKVHFQARDLDMDLFVVKHTEAKRGFVLLPRRYAVERSIAWAARFRRLERDYEWLGDTLTVHPFVACACLMLSKATAMLGQGS